MKFGLHSPGKTPWRDRLSSSSRAVSVFLVGILAVTFFRHFILEHSDPWKCQALLDAGHWYNGREWLTEGCANIPYGNIEIGRCAFRRSFVFAGDETLQGLFWAMANKLDPTHRLKNPGPKSEDLTYEKNHVRLEYIWDPYLNGSRLMKHVDTFNQKNAKQSPAALVVGPSQWQLDTGAVDQFIRAVESIAQASYHNNPRYGFTSGYTNKHGPGDLVLFAPAMEPPAPLNGSVLEEFRVNRDINDKLRHLADQGTINLMWSFQEMMTQRQDKFEKKFHKDLYPKNDVFHRQADTLLNLRCNARMADGNVSNKTCCGTWVPINWQQKLFLTLGMFILPAVVVFDWKFPVLGDRRNIVRAFASFMGIISLQYITDRTHIFEQVKRLDLQIQNLAVMVVVSFVIGAITIRKSAPPKKPSPTAKQPGQPFLPRDQTEEWKGWMQLLIIIYHMNTAWQLDWFWMLIRLCVASYLFLTGFGHTVYFLQKKDFAFKRFAAVMLRTNLLPVALAFALRTRWLRYYYMPLSSFWYLVVYLTMALGKGWNDRTPLLLAKIAFSAACVHFYLHTPNLSESIVGFFQRTTRVSFDAGEFFHHRVEMDHYIPYVGMLSGMLYVWAKDVLAPNSRRQDALSRHFRRSFPMITWLTVAAAAVAMARTWYTFAGWSQSHFSARQHWASIAPVLAFTVLRNAHPFFRDRFSFAFAWLGKYSGEMYCMQNHIWLAGDQEAVLRTGIFHGNDTFLGDRWRDLLFTTPLYLIACCIIGDATAAITTWFCTEKRSSPEETMAAAVKTSKADDEKRSAAQIEMRLLSDEYGADDSFEDMESEAGLLSSRRPSRRERLRARLPGVNLWPDTVGNRAVLLMLGLWVLNWTYT